jgi:hypothetical protein
MDKKVLIMLSFGIVIALVMAQSDHKVDKFLEQKYFTSLRVWDAEYGTFSLSTQIENIKLRFAKIFRKCSFLTFITIFII